MATKKKETAPSNGGSQIFLSQEAQEAIAEIQYKMASQSRTAMEKYGGRGGKSLVIEELAKSALAMRGSAENLAEKTS
jgi:hypothetical protein